MIIFITVIAYHMLNSVLDRISTAADHSFHSARQTLEESADEVSGEIGSVIEDLLLIDVVWRVVSELGGSNVLSDVFNGIQIRVVHWPVHGYKCRFPQAAT